MTLLTLLFLFVVLPLAGLGVILYAGKGEPLSPSETAVTELTEDDDI
jgi:hypothetical protein